MAWDLPLLIVNADREVRMRIIKRVETTVGDLIAALVDATDPVGRSESERCRLAALALRELLVSNNRLGHDGWRQRQICVAG